MIIPIKSKGGIYNVLIDDEDYEKFSEYNWCINNDKKSNNKYCMTDIYINGKKTTLKLHRFLMNLVNGDKRIINHIDGNGLNNNKSNLEICDHKYNTQSINTKKNFGCICIINRPKKYCAQVNINKKRYSKCFFTKEEAEAWLDGLKQIAIAETIPFQ
jgi:hypothetical protein